MAVANDAVFVMPQVEDITTLDELDAYLAVPGIDAVCVGPNDLSGTMGLLRQTEHPTVRAAVARIYAAAKARDLPVCLGVTVPTEAMPALAEQGVRMLLATADLDLLVRGGMTALANARQVLSQS
jgi:2-keto-3-deoxy-L-rhamnonate aldolase RhmA